MKTLEYYESLIIELPTSISWHNPYGNFKDGIHEPPVLKDGISIADKIMAIIAAYNKIDKAIGYKKLIKLTSLSKSSIKLILDGYRKSGVIYWHTLIGEDGLLCGKGLVFNESYV